MLKRKILAMIFASALTACGGDGDKRQENADRLEPTIYTGMFVDSAVQNLHYVTETQSGATNIDGEFSYQLNEQVTFSVGDIQFPAVAASALITPLTIFDTDDINQVAVVNMLRLIQSLDADGDLSNGIEITDHIHQLAKGITVEFASEDFVRSIANLIQMSGTGAESLVDSIDAVAHFEQTLIALGIESMGFCSKTHEKIGYSGYFSTLAHNVTGKATIIDDCTIEITEFYYDGGGPDVYIYGAIGHQYGAGDAFAMGENLSGTPFDNAALTLRLPNGRTLDDLTGLSVWCTDFNVDFGHMTFTP